MRHAVDEVRLPLVQADLLDRDRQVEHHPHQHQDQENRAHGQQAHSAPVETDSTTQPIISATSSTIITTPSVIGQPNDLRRDMDRLLGVRGPWN